MERVVFHVDATGEQVSCLLNPESVTATRTAGVGPRRAELGSLAGGGLHDDPLVFTGGGSTVLDLQLLFDVSLLDRPEPAAALDVRNLTGPLWRLAENSERERGGWRPPLVRFVWGRSWNVPGVIVALAERFDQFDLEGVPQRSWITLRFRRVSEPGVDAQPVARSVAPALTPEQVEAATSATGDVEPAARLAVLGATGERDGSANLPLMAWQTLGDPGLWRVLALRNDLDDPLAVPAGAILDVPPRATLLAALAGATATGMAAAVAAIARAAAGAAATGAAGDGTGDRP